MRTGPVPNAHWLREYQLPWLRFDVIAGLTAAAVVLRLQAHGVATVGEVPIGLPSLVLPDLSLIAQLWPAAL